MQSVSFKDLVYAVADLAGVSPDEDGGFGDLLTTDLMPITRSLDSLLREAWRFYPFPDTVDIVEAAYRPLWTATDTYADGDEVYFNTVSGEEGYYTANATTTAAQSPVTNPELWDALEITSLIVDPDEWGIGDALDVFKSDPRVAETERAIRVPFAIRTDGIQVASTAGDTVWVEFKKAVPRLRGNAFDEAATYAVGDAMLYTNEDFYVALGATTAGQSPDTNPELWQKQEVPMVFRNFLVHRAAAIRLKAEGERDQARDAEQDGWEAMYREIDNLEGQSAQIRRWTVTNPRRV